MPDNTLGRPTAKAAVAGYPLERDDLRLTRALTEPVE
jgi:hypothetical protein